MSWVRIATFRNFAEAQVVKSKLDSFGIPSHLDNSHVSVMYGGSLEMALMVHEDAVKDALWILEEEPNIPTHCPVCQSHDIESRLVAESEDKKSHIHSTCHTCKNSWTT